MSFLFVLNKYNYGNINLLLIFTASRLFSIFKLPGNIPKSLFILSIYVDDDGVDTWCHNSNISAFYTDLSAYTTPLNYKYVSMPV